MADTQILVTQIGVIMKNIKFSHLLLIMLLILALALPNLALDLRAEEAEETENAASADQAAEEEVQEEVDDVPTDKTFVASLNGDTQISLLEMNFHAGLLFQQLTQTPAFAPQAADILSSPLPDDPDKTVRDTILELLQQELALKIKLAQLAEEAATELTADDQALIDNFFNSFAQNALQSGVSTDQLLEQFFGPGANQEKLRPIVEKDLLQSLYLSEVYQAYEITEEEITAEYEANPQDYDLVDFLVVQLDAEISEEDLAKVQTILEEATEEDFAEQLAPFSGYASEDQEKVIASSRQEGVSARSMIPASVDWLFDPARKAGDTSLIQGTNSQSALFFISRYRDEGQNYDSRHILIKEAGDTELDYQVATATAQALYEGIKDQVDEDFFAELAAKYSQDPGSQQNGGLYEDVAPGSFVAPYENFCLDPDTQEGQLGLVHVSREEASYAGYHLIYFKGLRDPNWYRNADTKLRTARQEEFLENLKAENTLEYAEEGRELILPLPLPVEEEEAKAED